MKLIDNGCLFSVTVSRMEVEAFKDSWPGAVLPDRFMWFQFDKRNGDLVDIRPYGCDGPEVVALAEDAKQFGLKKIAESAE